MLAWLVRLTCCCRGLFLVQRLSMRVRLLWFNACVFVCEDSFSQQALSGARFTAGGYCCYLLTSALCSTPLLCCLCFLLSITTLLTMYPHVNFWKRSTKRLISIKLCINTVEKCTYNPKIGLFRFRI